MVAALKTGRNSVGIEIDPEYCKMTENRLRKENDDMFSSANLEFIYPARETEVKSVVSERRGKYGSRAKKTPK
jgi:site-specific DNA-methyltransferase (adenine-specific)